MDVRFMYLLLLLSGTKSFVSPAPSPEGVQPDQEVSDEVQQLDELRKEHAKPTNNQPLPEPALPQGTNPMADHPSQSAEAEAPKPEPSPKSNSRSAIFRHRGITEAKKNRMGWDNTPKQQEGEEYAKFTGVQYTPADLAEYIFRTGDEEGVALAVEELVREGMMGRTDAISYLQDVKETLMYMRDQYEQARRLQDAKSRAYPKPQISQRLPPIPREQFVSQLDTEKREPKPQGSNPRQITTAEPPHQVATASTPTPKLSTRAESTTSRPQATEDSGSDASGISRDQQQQQEAAMLEKLRAVISLYDDDEYTLQEVIYQLAKDMFTQSMTRGDQTAEETLSRLITFLETKVDNKRISGEMKEKVLEIVSAALVDSLREYPGLLSDEQASQLDSEQNSLYRQGQGNGLSPDKRSIQEEDQKMALSGASKTHQLPASNSGQKTSENVGVKANAMSLQQANFAPTRSKRT